MKKLYSIVLMAAALLVSTNMWAEMTGLQLQQAINGASSGSTITLTSDVILTPGQPIWLGTLEVGEPARSITLDLNGFNISCTATAAGQWIFMFIISHGELYVVNNGNKTEGHGEIKMVENGSFYPQANSAIFTVFGSYKADSVSTKNVTTLAGGLFTHLDIAAEVKLKGTRGSAITVDVAREEGSRAWYQLTNVSDRETRYAYTGADMTKMNQWKIYRTNVLTSSASSHGFAFGARVDVSGDITMTSTAAKNYCVKANGILRDPQDDNTDTKAVKSGTGWDYLTGLEITPHDTINVPYIYIHNGADLQATGEYTGAAGLYCAGYAHWTIQGNVSGSTGVYVKSGNIEVADGAQITATNSTAYGISTTGMTSGIDAGGNAIAIESNTNDYAGGVNLDITGGTITAGAQGYAIQNVNATGSEAVESVVISGGTFDGGASGCVTLDPNGTPNVELTGGTFDGSIESLVNAVGEDQIITSVVSIDPVTNQATVVVGPVEAGDDIETEQPVADENAYSLVDTEGNIVKLTSENGGYIHGTLGASTVTLKYLSLTGTATKDVVITVEEGKTLNVGQIVMNAYGKIIVKAGGKLIVTGANGLFADNVENIVLEATQGNQSLFIMNPAVANNKHPKATVELISKSFYVDDNNYLNQRFGIPTIGALESITADYPTRIWGYFNAHWDLIGTVVPGTAFDASVMDQPFAYYQMSSNNPSAGTKVTMTGRLVGVEDPQIDLIANNWSTFSNSFMANIDASAMMDMFEGHPNIDATIQTFKPTNTTNFAWFPFNRANILMGENTDVEPMQAFIVKNLGAADQLQINYQSMIWEPFTASLGASAPARRKASADITTARVEVANAQGAYDYVTLLSDAQFSAEYENGYDAEHVMNNNLDLYTVGVQNLATMATDNLDNTVLGMACAEAGEYTITFSHINGDNLTLIDRITGARIDMVEGNTYEFTAEAGEANRFEIVSPRKVTTAIENTDAVKSVKGAVYTITGQYVGSVENWNVLPAGVYVVDGIKCVK